MSRPLDTNLNDITTVAEAVQFLQAVKAQHIAPRPLLPNGALAINLPEGSSPPDIGAPDAPYGTIFANVLQIGGAPLDTTISAELERFQILPGGSTWPFNVYNSALWIHHTFHVEQFYDTDRMRNLNGFFNRAAPVEFVNNIEIGDTLPVHTFTYVGIIGTEANPRTHTRTAAGAYIPFITPAT